MRDINRAERLLSLFTTPDSAAGIVGDLSEERGHRGSLWLWRQVLGTALSLVRGATFEAPAAVLSIAATGLVLMFTMQLAGTMAALHVLLGSPWAGPKSIPPITAVAVVVAFTLAKWIGALLAGAIVGAVAPRRGAVACVVMIVLVEISLIFEALRAAMPAEGASHPAVMAATWVAHWTWGQAIPAFLLLGGALTRRRWLRRQARPA
jgi:hypothetical protein